MPGAGAALALRRARAQAGRAWGATWGRLRAGGGAAAALLCYLVWLAAAEYLTTAVNPQIGVVLHAALLVLIPLYYAFAQQRHDPLAPFILTLTLGPLIRILSLTLPLGRLPLITWYLIIAVPLFAATYVVSRALGLTRAQVGLVVRRHGLGWQALIAASGLLLGLCEYLILRPQALVVNQSWGMVVLAALILLVGTGMLEEVIFRGVMQHLAGQALGVRGLVYVSVVFAILHIGYLSVVDLGFVFAVGLFFAWVVRRTGSLLGVVLAHGITNILLYLVLPSVGGLVFTFFR